VVLTLGILSCDWEERGETRGGRDERRTPVPGAWAPALLNGGMAGNRASWRNWSRAPGSVAPSMQAAC
jgi:hypothetical protein